MPNCRWEKWVRPNLKSPKGKNIVITKWGWAVTHPEHLILGNFTDIGFGTYINALNGIIIEDYVQISSHCSIYSVSTIDNKRGKVILRKNCRIGSHSVIMPGVTIGENSIIGAFSFVNKDIPSNCIVYGIPVKVIKKI